MIAVIHRKDDIEEKWVVAPLDAQFSKEEIAVSLNNEWWFYEPAEDGGE